jgi:hypothetical protein
MYCNHHIPFLDTPECIDALKCLLKECIGEGFSNCFQQTAAMCSKDNCNKPMPQIINAGVCLYWKCKDQCKSLI